MFAKRNLIKIFLVLFVLFLYFNSQTFAAPKIISILGTSSHGSTITISGSGFGIKKSVASVIWDNMESGSFNTKWSEVGSGDGKLVINSDNNRHPNSSFNGFRNFNGIGTERCAFEGGSDSPTWYVQYWFKLGINWKWGTSGYGGGDEQLSNVKFFRMWSTGSEKDNFYLNFHSWNNVEFETSANVSSPNGSDVYLWGSFKNDLTLDTWHLFQFEFKDSSMNTQDGEFRFWFNGKLMRETTTLKTRDGSTAFKRPKLVGFYDGWNGGNPGDHFMWIDDAYIDSSWARVEIGDNADYGSCTHREIQIPTAWDPASDPISENDLITITVNQGSFADKAKAFLFVVNSGGEVSKGYPVTFGTIYLDWR